jgi:hypothetical protein
MLERQWSTALCSAMQHSVLLKQAYTWVFASTDQLHAMLLLLLLQQPNYYPRTAVKAKHSSTSNNDSSSSDSSSANAFAEGSAGAQSLSSVTAPTVTKSVWC